MISVLHVQLLFRNLDRINERKHDKSSRSFLSKLYEELSNLYGMQNPFKHAMKAYFCYRHTLF